MCNYDPRLAQFVVAPLLSDHNLKLGNSSGGLYRKSTPKPLQNEFKCSNLHKTMMSGMETSSLTCRKLAERLGPRGSVEGPGAE